MLKNEIKLGKDINSIAIDVTTTNISIYSDNVKFPIVRTTGEINIKERYNEAIIEDNKSRNTMNAYNVSINDGNGITIVSSGNSRVQIGGISSDIIIINGKVFPKNENNFTTFKFDESSGVELIVPKKPQIQTFNIDTKSGNLTIKDLIFSKLVAKTMSGNITLNDIDVLFGKL